VYTKNRYTFQHSFQNDNPVSKFQFMSKYQFDMMPLSSS